jgi:hypothetical protein
MILTEIIYAIDLMTIIYVIVSIPIVLFLSSLAYHYAKELNKYNTSKRVDKTFKDGYEIIMKYNEALNENEELRKKIINGGEYSDD